MVYLDELVKIRNNLSHGKLNDIKPNELIQLSCKALEYLDKLLDSISFLANYPLFYAKSIQVNKQRLQTPKFDHTLSKMEGASPLFIAESKEFTCFTEPKDVILQYKLDNKFLTLTPFILHE
ncbi:hypothetical protein MBAV_006298 [Candidatus Magnetobacterium bavaricum]|uniref:MAE-28990/MAE-18760-like HEPN domain-containing protein n=1 Tax=Candidatus Magnetobacterium bavaricum TaxID=29290 RepID=A0A0F3GLF0_9BACT|nr:hypothetical protein MBAV_006298 [Candidatus Magnetobacterium bavaricum]